ncbi:BMP family ABC transporter substrate-binding protein [Halobacillus shinanisalinarum]|uniref:BMP family ABC transporter substrate-binding protein n=1 Tax=Halobacillus shinanisalinarum TaxID=2932258 RepID=A0ABY4GXN3_9BACI|nr:BMP family ABC transporter substrate-binding protein [Halobacillus shinanisalinarum]UOQ92824.1 BMP family ABC transporter substrate-binding protein [Halobacillus shinanisalinarum]
MKTFYILILITLMLLSGCQHPFASGHTDKVGMLVETTIHDQAWGQQGYKGLQSIQKDFGVDVYFKEGIKTESQTTQAVAELVDKGINVIFGHGNAYGSYFQDLHQSYPEVHFIYFNGQFSADNVTSLNFSANAMGFFAGMVAGEMTETNKIGLIAAFQWQPEVEGFYEGAKFQNPEADINITYTNNWEDTEKAIQLYNQMEANGADVFYPAGDMFNIPLIREIQDDAHYGIGYVSDQSFVAENTVLTSTVQRVDRVYNITMEKFLAGELPGKVIRFGFQEGAIEMGEYSPVVPEKFQFVMDNTVKSYEETGQLPNQ